MKLWLNKSAFWITNILCFLLLLFFQNCGKVNFNRDKDGLEGVTNLCDLSSFTGNLIINDTTFEASPSNLQIEIPSSIDLSKYTIEINYGDGSAVVGPVAATNYRNIQHTYTAAPNVLTTYGAVITLRSTQPDQADCEKIFNITVVFDLRINPACIAALSGPGTGTVGVLTNQFSVDMSDLCPTTTTTTAWDQNYNGTTPGATGWEGNTVIDPTINYPKMQFTYDRVGQYQVITTSTFEGNPTTLISNAVTIDITCPSPRSLPNDRGQCVCHSNGQITTNGQCPLCGSGSTGLDPNLGCLCPVISGVQLVYSRERQRCECPTTSEPPSLGSPARCPVNCGTINLANNRTLQLNDGATTNVARITAGSACGTACEQRQIRCEAGTYRLNDTSNTIINSSNSSLIYLATDLNACNTSNACTTPSACGTLHQKATRVFPTVLTPDLCAANNSLSSAVAPTSPAADTDITWACQRSPAVPASCRARFCGPNQIIINNGTACQTCPQGSSPSPDPADQRCICPDGGTFNGSTCENTVVIPTTGSTQTTTEQTKFVLIVDDTGSMSDELVRLRNSIGTFLDKIYALDANAAIYVYFLNWGNGDPANGASTTGGSANCTKFDGSAIPNAVACSRKQSVRGLQVPVFEIVLNSQSTQAYFDSKKNQVLSFLDNISTSGQAGAAREQTLATLLNTFWKSNFNYKLSVGDKVSFILFTDEDDGSTYDIIDYPSGPNTILNNTNNLLRPTEESVLGGYEAYRINFKYTMGIYEYSAYINVDGVRQLVTNRGDASNCTHPLDISCDYTANACSNAQKQTLMNRLNQQGAGLTSIADITSCNDRYEVRDGIYDLFRKDVANGANPCTGPFTYNGTYFASYQDAVRRIYGNANTFTSCQSYIPQPSIQGGYLFDRRAILDPKLNPSLSIEQNTKNILDQWFKVGTSVRYKLNVVANFSDASCSISGSVGTRYQSLVNLIGSANAKRFDLCMSNYDPIFNDILSGQNYTPTTQYTLQTTITNPTILEVRRRRNGVDTVLTTSQYSFNSSTKVLTITQASLLQAGDSLVVRYRP